VAETVKCKLHSSWSGGYGPFSRTNDSEGLPGWPDEFVKKLPKM
jgi:hypothetical protein